MENSERIEIAAMAGLHSVAGEEVRHEIGLSSHHSDVGFVSIASALPSSAIVVNRAIGLGLNRKASKKDLDALLTAYWVKSVSRYFVHVGEHMENHDEVSSYLRESGLQKARGWQKFEHELHEIPALKAHEKLAIHKIGKEHGGDFANIACDAFDLGDKAVAWLSNIVDCTDWHVFMSFIDGEPAGTGALYIKDSLGWFDFGATAPKFRQMGSQQALLIQRLHYAKAMGCERVYTCTGEEVQGDPQHSYNNILRAGFKETYIRANYSLPVN